MRPRRTDPDQITERVKEGIGIILRQPPSRIDPLPHRPPECLSSSNHPRRVGRAVSSVRRKRGGMIPSVPANGSEAESANS